MRRRAARRRLRHYGEDMTQLIAPTLACPECGLALDHVATVFADDDGGFEFDGWQAISRGDVISCSGGHRFEAIYEQPKPWLRVLVDFGVPISSPRRSLE